LYGTNEAVDDDGVRWSAKVPERPSSFIRFHAEDASGKGCKVKNVLLRYVRPVLTIISTHKETPEIMKIIELRSLLASHGLHMWVPRNEVELHDIWRRTLQASPTPPGTNTIKQPLILIFLNDC
jgi:hypothetical protein